MARKSIKSKNKTILIVILLALALIIGLAEKNGLINANFEGLEQTFGETASDEYGGLSAFDIHYIDVGQGDCSLIVCDGKTMLIDAGENGHETDVINYLHSLGISHLDYIIATHQHSDHIGGLAEVITEFGTDTLIMPRLTKEQTPTNSTYTAFLKAIQSADAKTLASNPGDVYELGSAKIEIFGPVTDDADDLNNMSIVLKATYGENTFLFTGDAEREEELEIIDTGADLKCDVLKAGHHGSKTSSSKEFLEQVKPEMCIIQVGADNDYGHPHSAALNRITKYTNEIYRNDICGNIVLHSDGIEITVEYDNQ